MKGPKELVYIQQTKSKDMGYGSYGYAKPISVASFFLDSKNWNLFPLNNFVGPCPWYLATYRTVASLGFDALRKVTLRETLSWQRCAISCHGGSNALAFMFHCLRSVANRKICWILLKPCLFLQSDLLLQLWPFTSKLFTTITPSLKVLHYIYIQINLHGTSPFKDPTPKSAWGSFCTAIRRRPWASLPIIYTQMEWIGIAHMSSTCHQRVINDSALLIWIDQGQVDGRICCCQCSTRAPGASTQIRHTKIFQRWQSIDQLTCNDCSKWKPVRLAAPTKCLVICLYVHIVILSLCVYYIYVYMIYL